MCCVVRLLLSAVVIRVRMVVLPNSGTVGCVPSLEWHGQHDVESISDGLMLIIRLWRGRNSHFLKGRRLKKKKKGPQECHCLLFEQLTVEDVDNGSRNRTEWAECAPPTPPGVGGGGEGLGAPEGGGPSDSAASGQLN